MAQMNVSSDNKTLFSLVDASGNVAFAIKSIGTDATAFTVFCLNTANVTYYFWVDNGADLAVSTTEPTATNSAATKIGNQT